MTKIEKIVLSQSRDIPFDRLMLSNRNVRRIQTGLSIEELAEYIANAHIVAIAERAPDTGSGGILRGTGRRAALPRA